MLFLPVGTSYKAPYKKFIVKEAKPVALLQLGYEEGSTGKLGVIYCAGFYLGQFVYFNENK